jgi:hypothetical protein
MSIACPVDLNSAVLRSEISSIYGRVAADHCSQANSRSTAEHRS